MSTQGPTSSGIPRTTFRPVNRVTELNTCFQLHRTTIQGLVEAIYESWDDKFQRDMFEADWNSDDVTSGREETWIAVLDESCRGLDAGTAVAMLEILNRPDELFIGIISVHPSLQGQGLGAWMLGWAQDRACQSRLSLTLEVWEVNTGAARLYRRMGFRQCGEKEGPGNKLKMIMKWEPTQEDDRQTKSRAS